MKKQWIVNLSFIVALVVLVCFHPAAQAATIAGNPNGKITLVEFMDY